MTWLEAEDPVALLGVPGLLLFARGPGERATLKSVKHFIASSGTNRMKLRGPSPKPARRTFAQQLESQALAASLTGSDSFRGALDQEQKAVGPTQDAALLPAREGI